MLSLTFDTDHMNELRMAEFLRDIEIPGEGTFFCTQRYACLDRSAHEVAPHPTLQEGGDWKDELMRMRDLFPDARGWRSHSCVFSHLLAEWLAGNGYRYVSTNDQFGQKNIRPIRHPWGIWHFPIFYMDNMDFSSGHFWNGESEAPFSDAFIDAALDDDGVYVFDFHPIHLLINTPDRDYYFSVRDQFKGGASIREVAYKGAGTRTFYDRLCAAMKQKRKKSIRLGAALEAEILIK